MSVPIPLLFRLSSGTQKNIDPGVKITPPPKFIQHVIYPSFLAKTLKKSYFSPVLVEKRVEKFSAAFGGRIFFLRVAPVFSSKIFDFILLFFGDLDENTIFRLKQHDFHFKNEIQTM